MRGGRTYRRFFAPGDVIHVHPASILQALAIEAGRYPDPAPLRQRGRNHITWTSRILAEPLGQPRDDRSDQITNRNNIGHGEVR